MLTDFLDYETTQNTCTPGEELPRRKKKEKESTRSAFLRALRAEPGLSRGHESVTVDWARKEVVFMKVESLVLRFQDITEVAQRGRKVLVVKTPSSQVAAEFQEEGQAPHFCKLLLDAPLAETDGLPPLPEQQQQPEPEESKAAGARAGGASPKRERGERSPQRRQSILAKDSKHFASAEAEGQLAAVAEREEEAPPPGVQDAEGQ